MKSALMCKSIQNSPRSRKVVHVTSINGHQPIPYIILTATARTSIKTNPQVRQSQVQCRHFHPRNASEEFKFNLTMITSRSCMCYTFIQLTCNKCLKCKLKTNISKYSKQKSNPRSHGFHSPK